MTHSDKLKALIQKAIGSDWDVSSKFKVTDDSFEDLEILNIVFFGDGKWAEWKPQVNSILFNHDFARALFGADNLIDHAPGQLWCYHLQQAVISKDPITYMYDAVFGEK